MRDDDRELREAVRDRPAGTAWDAHQAGGSLAPLHQSIHMGAVRRRRRWALTIASVAALAVAALWTRSTAAPALVPGAAALWNVELASTGARPVTALVFGEEAGLHVVRLPAAGAPPEERRRIPVRLARGDVYMVSLGRDGLDVSTAAPPGSVPMRFGARSRFVTLHHTARETGIRTGWW